MLGVCNVHIEYGYGRMQVQVYKDKRVCHGYQGQLAHLDWQVQTVEEVCFE